MTSVDYLDEVIRAQKRGQACGVVSICSANSYVIEAALLHAQKVGSPVLIESTCNQVNQTGGYTGMTPARFVTYVDSIAEKLDYPRHRLLLGGDHLGPYPWRAEPAHFAMQKSRDLVHDYVQAGYVKIHLDASMRCADDDPDLPVSKFLAAKRAADLAEAAEDTYQQLSGTETAPRYVIGTEVPLPGGAQGEDDQLTVTTVADVQETIELTRIAFAETGLEAAWDRVVAVVVQPGVEFSDAAVHEYDRGRAVELSHFIERYPNLVYEAHSTDYQTRRALKEMVEDHYAILKVGPALTFAFREAVFALVMIEDELFPSKQRSNLIPVIDQVMLADPVHWQGYYRGDDAAKRFARKFSFSDRIRYYWPDQRVQRAFEILISNLIQKPPPLSTLSQYFPDQYEAIRSGSITGTPKDLVIARILAVLNDYHFATGDTK
ncbi:MAG: D-tagatose-bisphosphate aldolase, class II, non-catalytic subunit [Chloroflexota bacterium]|nr:D-tagatose-bisphosphate aldolase, class II, non-catalytic subunit [Chloroflexota bacterium]